MTCDQWRLINISFVAWWQTGGRHLIVDLMDQIFHGINNKGPLSATYRDAFRVFDTLEYKIFLNKLHDEGWNQIQANSS